jgi:uncharacterized ferritin-like protein (DUF455 family)
MELRQRALAAFVLTEPVKKARAVNTIWQQLPQLEVDTSATLAAPDVPGRPAKPALVEPQDVPHRSPFTPAGLAALLHSIAHIEFNAINLALDAVWRFAGMPGQYYRDWMQVADEEAKHFMLLRTQLVNCGYDYGDFVAHDGLWTMCENTRHDVVARMALVPRTMEARGLDATPIIQKKLARVGTPDAIAASGILDIILREEVGHVAIGNHWYHWLCQRDNIEAESFYAQAAKVHGAPRLRPPFNLEARRLAGFTEQELSALSQI